MFDSPMEHCPVCGQMVILDQSKAKCGLEHACKPGTVCPLEKYFVGTEGRVDAAADDLSHPG
ncbi:MAG: hypothetical protein K8R10_13615 [Rhodocyclales bacterium]|jgi:hypothetical protein|nr:hypothetical protein [Rhodocyclales bacterium]